jgi:hypothetical protein
MASVVSLMHRAVLIPEKNIRCAGADKNFILERIADKGCGYGFKTTDIYFSLLFFINTLYIHP